MMRRWAWRCVMVWSVGERGAERRRAGSWTLCGGGLRQGLSRFVTSRSAMSERTRVEAFEKAYPGASREGWVHFALLADVAWRRWAFLGGRERPDVIEFFRSLEGSVEEVAGRPLESRPGLLRRVVSVAVGPVFIVCLVGVLVWALLSASPGPVLVMCGAMWLAGVPVVVARERRSRARRRCERALLEGLCPDCGYDTGMFAGPVSASRVVGPRHCSECGSAWPMVPPVVEVGVDYEIVGEGT